MLNTMPFSVLVQQLLRLCCAVLCRLWGPLLLLSFRFLNPIPTKTKNVLGAVMVQGLATYDADGLGCYAAADSTREKHAQHSTDYRHHAAFPNHPRENASLPFTSPLRRD